MPPPSQGACGGALDHSATDLIYEESSIFSIILLADFLDVDEAGNILGNGFHRVRASWSMPLNIEVCNEVYFHIQLKKRALLVRILSHQSFEKFSPRILFTSKMEDINFFQFESSVSPNFWLFTLFRKLIKVIFFVKQSSKCHGNALELFKSSWFIQILDDF